MAKAVKQYNTKLLRLPPELEQRLKELALPPDVVHRFREFALPPDVVQRLKGLKIPVESDIPPELVQAVEQALAAEKPAADAPAAKRPTDRIVTKAWAADWQKKNPKRKGETDKGETDKGGTDKGETDKGETDTAYAKRMHSAMQNANVTVLWSEATCRRRLYLDRDAGGNLDTDAPGGERPDPRPRRG
jgi:hypothetical protein